MVQWLGIHAFTAKGPGSIPGQRTEIPQAMQHSQKTKQKTKIPPKQKIKKKKHPQKQKNPQQTNKKPKVSRRKEIIKIRADINEIESKETVEKINETKS